MPNVEPGSLNEPFDLLTIRTVETFKALQQYLPIERVSSWKRSSLQLKPNEIGLILLLFSTLESQTFTSLSYCMRRKLLFSHFPFFNLDPTYLQFDVQLWGRCIWLTLLEHSWLHWTHEVWAEPWGAGGWRRAKNDACSGCSTAPRN